MNVRDLRYYGMAFSDAEGSWPPELKAKMKKKGMSIVLSALGPFQKLRFGFAFLKAQRKAKKLDLSSIRERGMNNEGFLKTQLEYLAMFSALTQIIGTERAIQTSKKIMDETAHEALLLCLPKVENMQQFEDPFETFFEYLQGTPAPAWEGGCHKMTVSKDEANTLHMDVTWCVWLELATMMGLPEACIPNCYSDDLVFPEYFEQFGIKYSRSQTLACGGCKCDFTFERLQTSSPTETPPPQKSEG